MDTGYQIDARMNIAVNQVNITLHCILQCIPMNGNEPFHENGTIRHLTCVK